jgi:allophanate hydrolase
MISDQQSLEFAALARGYREGRFTPRDVVAGVLDRIRQQPDHHAWITVLTEEQVEPYLLALEGSVPGDLPLFGIPFAIKDNIDLAGVSTTAACPDYAYIPERSAVAVQRLIDAGAIPIGKTNLDQFATGLVGARSPYGAGQNPFNPDYISGGSSSGSAIAVAMGQVSFALGSDTAGSGRVPAAFNNLVGIKPTRGLISTSGLVPACRSLDCISLFALTCGDAKQALETAAAFDPTDAFSRPAPRAARSFSAQGFRFGVPRNDQLAFFDNPDTEPLFAQAVERLTRLGGEAVHIDFTPFLEAARLLYEGPWVAERYVAIEDFLRRSPESLLPVTRQIIAAGQQISAADAFRGQYRLAELRRLADAVWPQLDLILTPTAATLYPIDAVEADPIQLNANLGYYTNFVNLLDLTAVAVPAGFQDDGLPFGVTLLAPAFAEASLLAVADRFHTSQSLTLGATGQPCPPVSVPSGGSPPGTLAVAVCGAHLSGLPLNHQLTDRGAFLLETTETAASYRLYALPGGPPHRPGLVRAPGGGSIQVELWALPSDRFGDFLDAIPAPLGLGKVELADGRWVTGFICEAYGLADAEEITAFGGWREFMARMQ